MAYSRVSSSRDASLCGTHRQLFRNGAEPHHLDGAMIANRWATKGESASLIDDDQI
jgi:hypothetical protein